MKKKIENIIIFLIIFYQKTLSLDTGILKQIGLVKKPVCVFYPSCSNYTIEAIQKYGVLKGIYLGVLRILRCHPWQKNHFDPLK
ncbi:MAG TPA: membrane protein insertion efficiency factor YidD [Candidatus Paceibacterota bacterium]|nr:membrane protein insertion efficiency factor YidD [Candidatus Paceibacterota bacterium]HPT18004.1 membrane protein insertion efficiency factor YidD [Candidatus Paceibacterota bacterium]